MGSVTGGVRAASCVFIGDLNDAFATESDLRFAIAARFREECIAIPLPQSDLNIRSLDGAGNPVAQARRKGAEPSGDTTA